MHCSEYANAFLTLFLYSHQNHKYYVCSINYILSCSLRDATWLISAIYLSHLYAFLSTFTCNLSPSYASYPCFNHIQDAIFTCKTQKTWLFISLCLNYPCFNCASVAQACMLNNPLHSIIPAPTDLPQQRRINPLLFLPRCIHCSAGFSFSIWSPVMEKKNDKQ